MSPILFNVVLEFVLSKLSYIDGGNELAGSKDLKDLDYDDDLRLTAVKTMTEFLLKKLARWA